MLAATRLLCISRYLYQEEFLRKPLTSRRLLLLYSLYSNAPGKMSKATPLQERRMIDRFMLHVKGGDGGSGNASLHRSRTDRNGKADGGNGGRGGDVILRCTSAVWDFRGLQHHINGERGGQGASKNKIGSRGEDKVVQVPVGTVIHLMEGETPSTVEKSSSGTNPWDVPGTVTSDILSSDQLSTSSSQESEMDQAEVDASLSSTSNTNIAESSAYVKPFSNVSSIQSCSQASRSLGKLKSKRGKNVIFVDKDETDDYGSLSDEDSNLRIDGGKLKSKHSKNVIFVDYDNMDDSGSLSDEVSDLRSDSCMSEEELQEDMKEIQYNFAELTEEGQQLIVARGGEGGLGSVVSSGRRRKKILKETNHGVDRNDNLESSDEDYQPDVRVGLPGSQASLILELKSIADVGLVGMPNAGKSTLLGAISRAKPAVGHYAFTTLRPNIGKLKYDELSISVSDIPGLIKGAHKNRGLGHSFLRHIERTKVLAYVIDLAAALDGRKGIPPWEQLRDLVLELEHYQEGLSDRPSLVVANKIDEPGAECVLEELQSRVRDIPIYPVCAVLEEGIPDLKTGLKQLVNGGEPSRLRLGNILVD